MGKGDLHEDLAYIAGQLAVLTDRSYSFRGEPRDLGESRFMPLSETGQPVQLSRSQPALVAFIESEIYQSLYRRPADGIGKSIVKGEGDHEFIERLSAANAGSGTWEPGWSIVAIEPQGRVGVKRDVVCWVRDSQLRTSDGGIGIGLPCFVKIPKEIRHLVVGYYMAIGDISPVASSGDTERMVRVYWNLTEEGAVEYIRRITTALNGSSIPFRTKVVGHRGLYQNADSGVLYIARSDFERAAFPIRAVYEALAGVMAPYVPLFTKCLRPGLGVAEDPGNGLSGPFHK
jgi:hypothetical protein